jgi:glycosyltransferase involved in cell wall biosynthesis
MHIAFDVSPLSDNNRTRGTGTYTQRLLAALEHTNGLKVSPFRKPSDIPASCDIIHIPYFSPFFLTLPLGFSKPCVVTVHDLIPLHFADRFQKGIRGEIKWQIQRHSLAGANAIITDSFASKKDIVTYVNVEAKNVHVIYLGPSVEEEAVKKSTLNMSSHLNISDPYLLYVGDVNWNKNVPGLLAAFRQVRNELHTNPTCGRLSLFLVGGAFLNTSLNEVKEIDALIREWHLGNYVKKLGHVSETDLILLYKKAKVLVQPSYAEGFGLPVVDAMSLGCPVVTSKTFSLSEIAGPAKQVDPTNPSDIARGIIEVLLLSTEKQKEIIKKQEKWVKRFSWEKAAKETIHVYETVLGEV